MDQKVTELVAENSPADSDITYIVTDVDTTPTSKKVSISALKTHIITGLATIDDGSVRGATTKAWSANKLESHVVKDDILDIIPKEDTMLVVSKVLSNSIFADDFNSQAYLDANWSKYGTPTLIASPDGYPGTAVFVNSDGEGIEYTHPDSLTDSDLVVDYIMHRVLAGNGGLYAYMIDSSSNLVFDTTIGGNGNEFKWTGDSTTTLFSATTGVDYRVIIDNFNFVAHTARLRVVDREGTTTYYSGTQNLGSSATDLKTVYLGQNSAGTGAFLYFSIYHSDSPYYKKGSKRESDIVVGPGSTTDGAMAFYDGTTGKLLKNGGVLNIYDNIWVDAGAMISRTTNGAASGTDEASTYKEMSDYFAFDKDADEFVGFRLALPDHWNRGTIKAKFYWTASAGTTGTVKFYIQAVALSNDDAIDTDFGTAVGVEDTFIAQGDVHVTSATAAITVAGSPALGDVVYFQVYRDVSEDDFDADAKLLGVMLQFQRTNTGVAAW